MRADLDGISMLEIRNRDRFSLHPELREMCRSVACGETARDRYCVSARLGYKAPDAQPGGRRGKMAQNGSEDMRADEIERMNREILEDRERVFTWFIRIGAWGFALAFLILVILALTQT